MRSTPPVMGSIIAIDQTKGDDMGEVWRPRLRSVARSRAFVGAVLGAILVFGALRAEGQVPMKRAGGPKLKSSLNAYSFNKALVDHLKDASKGMSLFQLLDFCAEHDFDAIDPTGY